MHRWAKGCRGLIQVTGTHRQRRPEQSGQQVDLPGRLTGNQQPHGPFMLAQRERRRVVAERDRPLSLNQFPVQRREGHSQHGALGNRVRHFAEHEKTVVVSGNRQIHAGEMQADVGTRDRQSIGEEFATPGTRLQSCAGDVAEQPGDPTIHEKAVADRVHKVQLCRERCRCICSRFVGILQFGCLDRVGSGLRGRAGPALEKTMNDVVLVRRGKMPHLDSSAHIGISLTVPDLVEGKQWQEFA